MSKQILQKQKSKTGPEPDAVKIKGDWEDAIGKALEKERPEGGWPDDDKKAKKDK